MISQHSQLAILFHTDDTSIAVLVDRESPLIIECQSVGAGLAIFANIHAAIAGLRHENGKLAILRPTINNIVVGVAEQKIAIAVLGARDPDRTFREKKSSCKFLDAC